MLHAVTSKTWYSSTTEVHKASVQLKAGPPGVELDEHIATVRDAVATIAASLELSPAE